MDNWFFNKYYIFNSLICLVYPILRIIGLRSLNLQIKDSWGFQRESHIISGILTFIIIKFLKYYSGFKKFLNDIFFLVKFGTLIMLFFIKPVFTFWYLFGCISIFNLIKAFGFYISHHYLMEKQKSLILSQN